MKYAIFVLAVCLIAQGCGSKNKPVSRKTGAEESITKTIARIDKINDTLSVFTLQFTSGAKEELNDPAFQQQLQAKLEGFSRHLSNCKSEVKSLALIDKTCRSQISKLQEVISKTEEKISFLQKEIASLKVRLDKKEPHIARAL